MRVGFVLLVLVLAGCGAGSGVHGAINVGLGVSPPFVDELVPSGTPANSVPFSMTVRGSNFTTDAVVFWNDAPQHTFFVDSTQLIVSLTEADLMLPGAIRVYVRAAGMNSNTVQFDVTG